MPPNSFAHGRQHVDAQARRIVIVHGDLDERKNEQQNIEQGTPNVEGLTKIPVK
jgi:hypothetical protein